MATEAKRYYDEAGITPTNVIQELFRRMQETDDNREALLLGHEIMRYHPDFEPNDMPMVSGRGSRGVLPLKAKAWLGDATIVKGIIDEPKDRPQPDAAAAAAATSEEADNAVQD